MERRAEAYPSMAVTLLLLALLALGATATASADPLSLTADAQLAYAEELLDELDDAESDLEDDFFSARPSPNAAPLALTRVEANGAERAAAAAAAATAPPSRAQRPAPAASPLPPRPVPMGPAARVAMAHERVEL